MPDKRTILGKSCSLHFNNAAMKDCPGRETSVWVGEVQGLRKSSLLIDQVIPAFKNALAVTLVPIELGAIGGRSFYRLSSVAA